MLCSSAGCTRPFSFVWNSAPGFLSGDIFIFHAKINSSTFFISTYGTVCWQNGWIYWGFPHITCRHGAAAAGSKYQQPNNLVIALCLCHKESGRWMFCPTQHPFCSQGLRHCSVIFMGWSKWWNFSKNTPLLLVYVCIRASTISNYKLSWQRNNISQ